MWKFAIALYALGAVFVFSAIPPLFTGTPGLPAFEELFWPGSSAFVYTDRSRCFTWVGKALPALSLSKGALPRQGTSPCPTQIS